MFGSKFDRRILTGSEFFCFNFNRKQLAAFELVSYGFVSWNEIPRKRKHSVVTFFSKLQKKSLRVKQPTRQSSSLASRNRFENKLTLVKSSSPPSRLKTDNV